MDLSRLKGTLGVWTWLDGMAAPEAADFARRVEAMGYSMLFVPEAVGREPFALLGYLAAGTSRLVFATGIANIYARDPMTTRAAQLTLAELSGDRFVLGLGVSHQHLVSRVRGHDYKKPVTTMRNYLEQMRSAIYFGPRPEAEPPILLAALRKNMLSLSAESASGAHPYLTTPEHTRRAREILGKEAFLAPEQMVLRERDPSNARKVARTMLKMYIGLPNYKRNLLWLGFEESDFEEGGSDRLVDAIVAWGDEEAIAERVKAHRDAGADHVCIQPFRPDGEMGPDTTLLESLAPARP